MEPLDEQELRQLLQTWEAPAAPASLKDRVFPPRGSRWRWLLTGTIRVPVPVGLAAVVLAALWIYSGLPARQPAPRPVPSVSLADFQPVNELEPRSVGEQK